MSKSWAPVYLSLSLQVSQSPSAVALMKVNSSAEILCSTSLPDPTGLYLRGRFHNNRDVLYLSIADRAVGRTTIHNGFRGRVTVVSDQDQEVKRCCDFTLRLSQLGVEDTDSYYCSWRYYDTKGKVLVQRHSNGTIIIVRGTNMIIFIKEEEDMLFIRVRVNSMFHSDCLSLPGLTKTWYPIIILELSVPHFFMIAV